MRLVQLPVGVGGADDPVPRPGDHEQHRRLGAQDEPGARLDAVTRHHDVDALRRADLELPALPHHRLRLVGPDAGGVDHLGGLDLDRVAVLEVADPDADHALALAQEPDDAGAARDPRAVRRRRPHQPERVAGVVHLRVPVLDGADQRVPLQRGGEPERLAPGEVLVHRQARVVAGAARQRVVERDAGADVRPLPGAVLQRVEERHRSHEVRRQPVEDQAALAQRLADQAEVEHLQVPQAAVDELARAGRRPAGPVARLHESHGQAAGRGVQRRPGPHDAAPDHHDVELPRPHRHQRRVPLLRTEPGVLGARHDFQPRAGVSPLVTGLFTGR